MPVLASDRTIAPTSPPGLLDRLARQALAASRRLLGALLMATLLPAAAAPPATTPAGGAAAAAPAALPAVPPRERAPGDLSQWRRLVLPNGIKVLLLSDPKLNVSSAALAVGVGSLADPPARQGLAHFLEHMLFLGTEKYPDITGFDAYLRRNSGVNNAYTAEDRTNYFIEIRHEAFEGALDRFAQFFIAPLFDARFTEREMNAVASEHQANLENDLWREQQLRTLAYAAGHPARHFGTGSRQTLAGVTRDELIGFYRAHYSANRMTLAITGAAGLDQLEAWARTYFGPVPDRQLAPLVWPAAYLPPKPALRVLRMEPIKDLRQLHLEFPLPSLQPGWTHKSAELLGFVMGGEGPGSLLAQLKSEGLATSLAAGTQAATRDYGALELQIGLTPEGLARWQMVVERVLAQAALLREQGLPPHLFAERRALAQLDERWRDRGEGANLAAALASLMQDHPLEVAERVPHLWLHEDRDAFAALAARIVPENMLVTIVAKGQPVDAVEPIYGTRYGYSEDSGPAFAALQQPRRVATLQLPRPNPFVPRRTTTLSLQPARLIDEPGLSLYHAQDTEFQRPQAAWILRHRLPRDRAGVRTAVLLRFYEACVREALNETTYVAAEAGLRFTLTAALDGVTLATEGWDEPGARLLDAVGPSLTGCRIAPERFAALKDRLLRELSAARSSDAWMQLRETRRWLVREFHATPQQMLGPARAVTQAMVADFARTLYARGKLEALALGNVGAADAVAAVRRVAQGLRTRALPDAQLLRNRQLVDRPGRELRSVQRLEVNNSALRREVVLGDDSPAARAIALVLSAAIGDPFYSEMRTRQQLGYIVQASAFEDERQTIAMFLVQSGEYDAAQLEERADLFIRTLPSLLAAMPAESWQTLVGGVRARLSERDKSIAERAQRLYALAYDQRGDWARNEATLQALDSLTQPRAAEALAQALAPATRRQRVFLGFGRDHPSPVPPTELGAWKQSQRYQSR